MRRVTTYSAVIKDSVLAKALAPNPSTVVELSKEFNIPYGTIRTWIFNMLKKTNVKQLNAPQRPQDKSAEAKLQAVFDTLNKTESECGAYCRQQGIYSHQLDTWKKQILEGLGAEKTKEHRVEYQQVRNENKKLKSDLHRKDKALAEVSALLILKKKADLLWGESEDD